jgi:hypothetical protein
LTVADRPHRLRSHPIRFGEVVAHLSDYPHVLVTACCDHEQGKAKGDIFEQLNVVTLIIAPPISLCERIGQRPCLLVGYGLRRTDIVP